MAKIDEIVEEPPRPSVFLAEAQKSPVKVNQYHTVEVKHTLDEAVQKIFVSDLQFSEIHTHADMKLLLGYGSVLFAGAGALYSYVVPFPACKPLLAVCVAGYFILSTAMWYYGLYVQKDVIFQGKLKDKLGIQPDLILSASSTLPKHSDLYSLKLEFSRQYPKKSGKSKDSTTEISKSIGSWFDVSGRFAADVFHADLIKLAGNDLFKEK